MTLKLPGERDLHKLQTSVEINDDALRGWWLNNNLGCQGKKGIIFVKYKHKAITQVHCISTL